MRRPFQEAVDEHGATVLRVCRAVLGATADAEDAWAETFLAALVAWPSLDEATNVQAWLVTVAHRKAVDVTRARSRRASPGLPHDHPAPTTGVDQAEAVDVWRAVAALPPRQRAAVAYHYYGGLPHAETARLVGGTAEAVRRASADGIATLRRVLAPTDEEGHR